jgi:transcriptional regulator with XRE-family HTH domain
MHFTHYKRPVKVTENWQKIIEDLKKYRNKKGISQETLAGDMGIEPSLMQKWETYKRVPSGFMFSCWLDALELGITIKPIGGMNVKRKEQGKLSRKMVGKSI